MRPLSTILLITLLGASTALPAQTRDENWDRCKGSDPDLSIGGCTALIQSGLENNSNLSTLFFNRGNAYRHMGDFDRSIQDYDQAVRLNPGSAPAFDNRGLAYTLKGDYDRAIADFDQALLLNPSNTTAYNNRAAVYMRKGDLDRAIADYDQALRFQPNNATALNGRGRAFLYLGRFAAAQESFAAVRKLDISDPYSAIWLYLATARAAQDGRHELEKSTEQISLTAWPGPVINLYLGKVTQNAVLSSAGDPDAKKDREQHCEAYFYLGEFALSGGARSKAKRLFQQSFDTGVFWFIEYAGAQVELKRLQASEVKAGR
jgi:lipoprotein NlpI